MSQAIRPFTSPIGTPVAGAGTSSGRMPSRNGIPFVIRDLAVCITGAGSEEWKAALDYCLAHSLDRDAARLGTQQIKSLGKEVSKCFSGLRGAIDKFLSPLVNAYASSPPLRGR
jgi:hypothetical protein